MAFVPVVNTMEINIRGHLLSVPVENTFYYLAPGAIDQAILDAVTLAVATWVADNLDLYSEELVFSEVYGRDLTSTTFITSTNTDVATLVGTGNNALPNNVSFALKRLSGFSGRSARGRIYWPGIADDWTDGFNYITGGVANALVAGIEAMDALVALEGVTPVIVSRYTLGAPRVTGVTFPITNWTYSDLRLDSSRGRLP